jgi:hypothetical protein
VRVVRRRAPIVRAVCALLAFAACRGPLALHPPFPDVPKEAIPAKPPRFERRSEYWDLAARKKKREWHVLVSEDGATELHGDELAWWPNGILQSKRKFEHGEATGEWSTWFANGALRSQCTLGERAPLAPMTWWFENGQVSSQGSARNGVREGRWTTWFANGVKESEGEYRANLREGEWSFWNEDGSLRECANFAAGVKIDSKLAPR